MQFLEKTILLALVLGAVPFAVSRLTPVIQILTKTSQQIEIAGSR